MLKINKTCILLITVCFLAGCGKTKQTKEEKQQEQQIKEKQQQIINSAQSKEDRLKAEFIKKMQNQQ